jgi:hypothetical protein
MIGKVNEDLFCEGDFALSGSEIAGGGGGTANGGGMPLSCVWVTSIW